MKRLERLAAHLLLAVWICGASLPLIERSHADIDVACGEVGWRHPGQHDQVREAVGAKGDGHCGVCHLQRAFRSTFISASSFVPVLERMAVAVTSGATGSPAYQLRQLAPRAPPLA